jgi:peptidoglycan/xylan/chitin deacetylase (PgdA/CDA1 family)
MLKEPGKMNATISIVMYHYVRELQHSRFPDIKGLSTAQFREQIAYIKKHYNVISGDDFMAALRSGQALPPQAALLTFDDGYLDHFTQVFPILDQAGLAGCFFPPAKCILENRLLDVNKIHFVLAAVPNKQLLVETILGELAEYKEQYHLHEQKYYWDKLAQPGRYDPAEVMFIKRILQRELPEELRVAMTDTLFRKYVSADELSFAKELYMSLDQLRCLRRHGMYVGSHGYNHSWLNRLDRTAQEQEIDRSLEFLAGIVGRGDNWIMCYPYGAYNASLLSVLASRGCQVGLTTQVGIANLNQHHPLELPRLNTNDLPTQADAPPNQWTLEVNALELENVR